MLTISSNNSNLRTANKLPAGAHQSLDMINDVASEDESEQSVVVVIDNRQLARECFTKSLLAHNPSVAVTSFATTEDWRRASARIGEQSIILLNVGNRRITEVGVASEIARVVNEAQPTPVVVISDSEELPQIVKALECGAKGYIPTTVSISVAAEAIELALAGGIFVPASSVMAMRTVINSGPVADRPMAGLFTARQIAVVEALRRGKANKIIAYELNLRESTVKVHIRNIMKKLKATNRTEVAFKIRDMFPEQTGPDL